MRLNYVYNILLIYFNIKDKVRKIDSFKVRVRILILGGLFRECMIEKGVF